MTVQYSNKQIVDALVATGGFIGQAAELLGCSHVTIWNRIKHDEDVGLIQKHIVENRLDLAESGLMNHIEAENLDAIKYYLDRIGRSRGYIKEVKVLVTDNISEQMRKAEKRIENDKV